MSTPETILAAPSPPGGDPDLPTTVRPFPAAPPWPADLAKPPGARYVAGDKIWRVSRGKQFLCSSPDPYHLAEMFAAIEAGEGDHEPPWPATLGPLPSGTDRLHGVYRVRRKKKMIAFARRPEDLLARLKASGAPITIAPKIIRPRGRPPSPLSFKVVGHVPTFSGIEVHFKRAPEPLLSPAELAARLCIKVVELRDVDLPHVRGRFNWKAVCRHLRELAAANNAPRWYRPEDY